MIDDKLICDLLEATKPMLNNELRNYIAPGLTSRLVGGNGFGLVRLFTSERETLEFITPHSHRFDFTCLVLSGSVVNRIFRKAMSGEKWCESVINRVCGADGLNNYVHTRAELPTCWSMCPHPFGEGDTYQMRHHEIHSIQFSRGARVLFFEGPEVTTTSTMLEPWENGKVVPTFRTEPWMFERYEPPKESP
jgi:hypothetical protein